MILQLQPTLQSIFSAESPSSTALLGPAATYISDSPVPIDVIGTEEIVIGSSMAVLLAFIASFLQSRRAQSDFVLWDKTDVQESEKTDSKVFQAEEWKEISQPDNYVFYNRKLNESMNAGREDGVSRVEQRWVVLALLFLFVPIFSVEFFFALSRQIMCGGNAIDQSDFASFLCSPAVDGR